MLRHGSQHIIPQNGDFPRILAMSIHTTSQIITGINKQIAIRTSGKTPPVGSIGAIKGRAINAMGSKKRINHHLGLRAILSKRNRFSTGIKASQANGVLVFLAMRNHMTNMSKYMATGSIAPRAPSPAMKPCHFCNSCGDTGN